MAAEAVFTPFRSAEAGPAQERPAEIWAGKMEITPDLAREWMREHEAVVSAERAANGGKARDNRPTRDATGIAKYARDMKAGRWHLNGETVKRAWNGTVPDGQHRLLACMRADVPFTSIVVTGVDPEGQDTTDTGLPRRLSDQLVIGDEDNAAILAAVTRWALRWLHGLRGGGGAAGYQPTQTEMMDYLKADPRLRMAAAYAARAKREFKPVRPPVYAMAWMVLHGEDWVAAEVFMERILDSADLYKNHPILALRNRLANAKIPPVESLNEHQQLALFCLAWNGFREDRTMARLQLPSGGLGPRNFPEPK
jgi:hypothetical protein